MKLTSTNRSIDLIVPITNAHLQAPLVLEHTSRSRAYALRAALRGRAASAATAGRPCEAFGFEFLSHAKPSREKNTVQSTASATARRARRGNPPIVARPVRSQRRRRVRREDKTNQTGSLIQKVEQLFGHPVKTSFSNLLFADLVVMAG